MPSPAVRGIITSEYVSAEARAFLARTTGLDSRHRLAYTKLINGLVRDGVWRSLDVLYIFAAQDQTTSLLNLVSSSFSASVSNSPTFTADQGWTGGASASNNILGPNLSTATQYARNAAHASVWEYSSRAGTNKGAIEYSGAQQVNGRNTGDIANGLINASSGDMTSANAISRGHTLAIRTGASAEALYFNGVQLTTNATASVAVASGTANIPQSTATYTISACSWGGDITDRAGALYNRLRSYMLAIAPGGV